MCGRIILSQRQAEISDFLKTMLVSERLIEANYNLTPSQDVYIGVNRRAADGSTVRSLEVARWGLVPSWAKDPSIGGKLTNARSETVQEKPSFLEAYARRRCLVPVNGYYEWYVSPHETVSGKPKKQPFCMEDPQGRPLAIAGLYEWWRAGPTDPWQLTCTLMTRAAAPNLERIHDRMPVIVPSQRWDWWLDNRTQVDVTELEPALLEAHAVSTAVNSSKSAGPELREPIAFVWE